MDTQIHCQVSQIRCGLFYGPDHDLRTGLEFYGPMDFVIEHRTNLLKKVLNEFLSIMHASYVSVSNFGSRPHVS